MKLCWMGVCWVKLWYVRHLLLNWSKFKKNLVIFINDKHYNLKYYINIGIKAVHKNRGLLFFSFIFISWRLITLQCCSGFCHTLTWISHGVTCIPHPDPPPTSLSTRSLWVFPVHQAWALVSCIQPGLVICFTLEKVSMLFSQNIPPSPSLTESKSLFCTSVSLFLFCI